MLARSYSTVIFDLYLTLATGFTHTDHEVMVAEMAAILRAPDPARFAQLFSHDTWVERGTGQLPTIEANIAAVCERLGWPVEPERIAEATEVRRTFMVEAMTPLPGALDTLAAVRARAYQTGLISDCSEETWTHWPQTPYAQLMDATVFSCEVGLLKPAPGIYAIACERLGVRPGDCVYIGDRPEELIGARSVGMYAIMSLPPHDNTFEAMEPNRPIWDGPTIPAIAALPTFLDQLSKR